MSEEQQGTYVPKGDPAEKVRFGECLPHQAAQYLAERAKEGMFLVFASAQPTGGRMFFVHTESAPTMPVLVKRLTDVIENLTKVIELAVNPTWVVGGEKGLTPSASPGSPKPPAPPLPGRLPGTTGAVQRGAAPTPPSS